MRSDKIIQKCENAPSVEYKGVIYAFDDDNQLRGYDFDGNVVRIFPERQNVTAPTYIYTCKNMIFTGYDDGLVAGWRLDVKHNHPDAARQISSHKGSVIYITSFEWKQCWYVFSYGTDDKICISISDEQNHNVWRKRRALYNIHDYMNISMDEFKNRLSLCNICWEYERKWYKECEKCHINYIVCSGCVEKELRKSNCPPDYGCNRKK